MSEKVFTIEEAQEHISWLINEIESIIPCNTASVSTFVKPVLEETSFIISDFVISNTFPLKALIY